MRKEMCITDVRRDRCADSIEPREERVFVVVRGIGKCTQNFFATVHRFGCWNDDIVIVQDEYSVFVHGATVVDTCKRRNLGALWIRQVSHEVHSHVRG